MQRRWSLSGWGVIALCSAAWAQPQGLEDLREVFERTRAEGAIERRLTLGELRGRLQWDPPAPSFTPAEHRGGSLTQGPGGIPILTLRGTPADMGAQHGHLLRQEVRALLQYIELIVGADALPTAQARARALFEEACPERYLQEAAALAEAAGVELDAILFAQWFTDLYRTFACTTLSAPTPEGAILARNLDFPGLGALQRYSVVVVAHPEGREPYVSVSWPGLIGVLSGQNRHLALSVMVVHNEEGARAGLPFQLAFRNVLEHATDVDQAERTLRDTALTVTNNLMLVDDRGVARVLELHPDGIVARHPDDLGRLACTNHFLTDARRQPRASLSYLNSTRRYRIAQRAIERRDAWEVPHARAVLADTASDLLTLQSMVFLPEAGALEVALCQRPPATDADFVRLPVRTLLAD